MRLFVSWPSSITPSLFGVGAADAPTHDSGGRLASWGTNTLRRVSMSTSRLRSRIKGKLSCVLARLNRTARRTSLLEPDQCSHQNQSPKKCRLGCQLGEHGTCQSMKKETGRRKSGGILTRWDRDGAAIGEWSALPPLPHPVLMDRRRLAASPWQLPRAHERRPPCRKSAL